MSFDADPLFNEKNAFYKGLFQQVINDGSDKEGAEAIILRAKVALNADQVLKELKSAKDDVSRAAYALALHQTGKTSESLKIVDPLISSTDANVQIIVATVLARDVERVEEAIDILKTMEENLDAVALLIQIYLMTNQIVTAQSTLQAAKDWAQDAELIQLAEMWISLRVGGNDNYQSAFYTAQEFADAVGTPVRMLLAQAVAEIHMQRYDEAEQTLQQVLSREPESTDALANYAVLQVLQGKDNKDAIASLQRAAPSHPLIVEIAQKTSEFDTLAGNYSLVEA